MLSGISRLSSQAISSFSSSLRFFSRCSCNWSSAPLVGQARDHGVEVTVLAAQFVQLAQQRVPVGQHVASLHSMAEARHGPSAQGWRIRVAFGTATGYSFAAGPGTPAA